MTDQILDIPSAAPRIYKDNSIAIATFLGGPLAGAYLIAENFKAFHDPTKAYTTWLYTIIISVVIFGILFLIPAAENVPNLVFPALFALAAHYVVKHFQGDKLTTHINSGGPVHSGWRVLAVTLISLIVTLLIAVGVALLFG
jgi:hypothetical protein